MSTQSGTMSEVAGIPVEDFRLLILSIDAMVSGVLSQVSGSFHGLGMIVASDAAPLPIFQLPAARIDKPKKLESLSTRLARYACDETSLHDGFHILSPELELRLASCYVAAPVPQSEWRPAYLPGISDRVGSRWITAMFASRVLGVTCTVVVNSQWRRHYFVAGEWVDYA
ncbi:MAG: hypothetical protein CPSOU_6527 [uncultured Paraburkholderia sp.]|nr:MAG: hypothetical protein CPSOU_6527 [uncultured Paraburkholderia sp.]